MAITFISHGRSKADEEQANADSVRAGLIERLKEFNWDVRVDDLLPAGADWRLTLYEWMAECDAAVVLVTRGGMTKPWLKLEANLLLWRRGLGAPVTILPVLLGGLEPRDLRGTEISQLASQQVIEQKSSDSCDDVVARIIKALGDMGECVDTSAMQSMRSKIEHCLDVVKQEFPLRGMAGELGARDSPFPTTQEGCRFIAHQFLGPVPTGQVPKAIKKVAFYLDPDRLKKLIGLAVPTWIDPVAVRRLLPEDGQVVVTLGNAQTETAKHHIYRASCFSDDYWVKVVPLVAGEEQLREHMAACERAVGELLGGDANTPPADDDVLFLVIDPHDTEPDVVGELLRALTVRFSWLNLVVLTGDANPEDLGRQHCRTLHIAVPPAAEDAVGETVRALKRILTRRNDMGKDPEQ